MKMTEESLILEFKQFYKNFDSLKLYEQIFELFDNTLLLIRNHPNQSITKMKILNAMKVMRGFLELPINKYDPEEDDRKLIINLVKCVVKKVLKDVNLYDQRL